MKQEEKQKISEEIRETYVKARDEIESKPTAWDSYKPYDPVSAMPDWRLWHSVDKTDIARVYINDLAKLAKKRHETSIAETLIEIRTAIDEALCLLDPKHYSPRKRRFMDITLDREALKQGLAKLEKAYSSYLDVYLDLSLKVEVPSSWRGKKRGWLMVAHYPIEHLRNSVDGIKKYLEEVKREAEG